MFTDQTTLCPAQADDAMSGVFVEKTKFARVACVESHWAFFGGMHQLVCETGCNLRLVPQPESLRRRGSLKGMR